LSQPLNTEVPFATPAQSVGAVELSHENIINDIVAKRILYIHFSLNIDLI